MRHGSLFSGIGGFDLAAEWMGWENVFHSEVEDYCNELQYKHFKNSIPVGNIKSADFKKFRGGGLTLFPVEIPASHTLLQGWEKAKKMSVFSGRKILEQHKNHSALGWLTKTLMDRLPTASLTSRLMIWKVKATPAKRIIYQLKRSGHYINDQEFGLSLITPTSMQRIESPEKFIKRRKDKGYINGTTFNTLASQLIYGLTIPTPTLNDSKNSTFPQSQSYCRKGYQGTLVSALMHMGISAGTKLNPELYECLMGYPKGWTITKGTNELKV